MSNSTVLYSAYHLYELEGIPAYPSPFTPVDFYIRNWLSISDTLKFRTEKHYTTRDSSLNSGLESYLVRTGVDGIQVRREYWEGNLFHETKESLDSFALSFDDWLARIAEKGRRFIDEAKRSDATIEVREETDDTFGLVQVIVSQGTTRGSDLYPEMPLEIVHKFDFALMRLVEQIETVITEDNNRVNHRHYRLMDWRHLQPDDVPDRVFDPEHIVGE